MILGLRRGTVQLVDYQPGWSEAFAIEKAQLARVLGGSALAIEHVGSTSVPGLAAKPILDVAIAVHSVADSLPWTDLLRGLGYTSFGDREGWGEHFFAKGPDENRTVYLHVVPAGSARWSDYLAFRDTLRARPELREEYQALKRQLLARHGDNRTAYTEGKSALVRRVIDGKVRP